MNTSTDALLSSLIYRGERLASAARMIGDDEDHRFWRVTRDAWINETVKALLGGVDGTALHTFERTAGRRTSEGSLAEDLPLDLEAMRDGLQVLRAIEDQLRRRGNGSGGERASRPPADS